MEYEIAGDPMSPLKWTKKTRQKISDELKNQGINISSSTVGTILKELNISLKANYKTISNGGKILTLDEKEARNLQFIHIQETCQEFKDAGNPIISCDTKKKELIGNFKNPGIRYCRYQDYVNDHDFVTYCTSKIMPYGIYDVVRNEGFVAIGNSKKDKKGRFNSSDTPEFAVESIEQWWIQKGKFLYSDSKKILILVDGGGSNGSRCHQWKIKIQEILANKYGLEVTICHYPPGASKWNPIEHRLFSEISKNWRGAPLRTIEVAEKYIKTTKTSTGLKVDAIIVNKEYQKGIKTTKKDLSRLNLIRNETNPLWNYQIKFDAA